MFFKEQRYDIYIFFFAYSQSQTEDCSSVVKVMDHFVAGCVVNLHMPERQTIHVLKPFHSFNFHLKRVSTTRAPPRLFVDTLSTQDSFKND